MESTLRTVNNLLERLHASFFFYILVTPNVFLKIGFWIPSVVILSVAMMFSGLHEWVNAAWYLSEVQENDSKEQQTQTQPTQVWKQRSRPVLMALSVMGITHLAGVLLFYVIKSPWTVSNYEVRCCRYLLTSETDVRICRSS